MTTKQDVINAANACREASFNEGLWSDDEDALGYMKKEEAAYENFKKALDEFEQTLLNKEVNNDDLNELVKLIMTEVDNFKEASIQVEAATNKNVPFSRFIKLVDKRDDAYTKCVNTISEVLKIY